MNNQRYILPKDTVIAQKIHGNRSGFFYHSENPYKVNNFDDRIEQIRKEVHNQNKINLDLERLKNYQNTKNEINSLLSNDTMMNNKMNQVRSKVYSYMPNPLYKNVQSVITPQKKFLEQLQTNERSRNQQTGPNVTKPKLIMKQEIQFIINQKERQYEKLKKEYFSCKQKNMIQKNQLNFQITQRQIENEKLKKTITTIKEEMNHKQKDFRQYILNNQHYKQQFQLLKKENQKLKKSLGYSIDQKIQIKSQQRKNIYKMSSQQSNYQDKRSISTGNNIKPRFNNDNKEQINKQLKQIEDKAKKLKQKQNSLKEKLIESTIQLKKIQVEMNTLKLQNTNIKNNMVILESKNIQLKSQNEQISNQILKIKNDSENNILTKTINQNSQIQNEYILQINQLKNQNQKLQNQSNSVLILYNLQIKNNEELKQNITMVQQQLAIKIQQNLISNNFLRQLEDQINKLKITNEKILIENDAIKKQNQVYQIQNNQLNFRNQQISKQSQNLQVQISIVQDNYNKILDDLKDIRIKHKIKQQESSQYLQTIQLLNKECLKTKQQLLEFTLTNESKDYVIKKYKFDIEQKDIDIIKQKKKNEDLQLKLEDLVNSKKYLQQEIEKMRQHIMINQQKFNSETIQIQQFKNKLESEYRYQLNQEIKKLKRQIQGYQVQKEELSKKNNQIIQSYQLKIAAVNQIRNERDQVLQKLNKKNQEYQKQKNNLRNNAQNARQLQQKYKQLNIKMQELKSLITVLQNQQQKQAIVQQIQIKNIKLTEQLIKAKQMVEEQNIKIIGLNNQKQSIIKHFNQKSQSYLKQIKINEDIIVKINNDIQAQITKNLKLQLQNQQLFSNIIQDIKTLSTQFNNILVKSTMQTHQPFTKSQDFTDKNNELNLNLINLKLLVNQACKLIQTIQFDKQQILQKTLELQSNNKRIVENLNESKILMQDHKLKIKRVEEQKQEILRKYICLEQENHRKDEQKLLLTKEIQNKNIIVQQIKTKLNKEILLHNKIITQYSKKQAQYQSLFTDNQKLKNQIHQLNQSKQQFINHKNITKQSEIVQQIQYKTQNNLTNQIVQNLKTDQHQNSKYNQVLQKQYASQGNLINFKFDNFPQFTSQKQSLVQVKIYEQIINNIIMGLRSLQNNLKLDLQNQKYVTQLINKLINQNFIFKKQQVINQKQKIQQSPEKKIQQVLDQVEQQPLTAKVEKKPSIANLLADKNDFRFIFNKEMQQLVRKYFIAQKNQIGSCILYFLKKLFFYPDHNELKQISQKFLKEMQNFDLKQNKRFEHIQGAIGQYVNKANFLFQKNLSDLSISQCHQSDRVINSQLNMRVNEMGMSRQKHQNKLSELNKSDKSSGQSYQHKQSVIKQQQSDLQALIKQQQDDEVFQIKKIQDKRNSKLYQTQFGYNPMITSSISDSGRSLKGETMKNALEQKMKATKMKTQHKLMFKREVQK